MSGEFAGVFNNADGSLFQETYNQLNAYFAAVLGGYAFNLRKPRQLRLVASEFVELFRRDLGSEVGCQA